MPPRILYQYRPPEAWALDNLCRQVMYFGSPENFNDPYDCHTPPTLRNWTDDQLLAVLEKVGFPAPTKQMLAGRGVRARLRKEWGEPMHILEENLGRTYARICRKLGVACFSECRDNLRMWSQYGGRGKGFCLAFDTGDSSAFPADKIIPVQYSEHWPSAGDTIRLLDGKNPRKFLAHKSMDWVYEREWRLLGARASESGYDAKTLKGVFFGAESTASTKEIVRLIVQEKYPHTELWSGKIHAKERKVDFDIVSRTDRFCAAPTGLD